MKIILTLLLLSTTLAHAQQSKTKIKMKPIVVEKEEFISVDVEPRPVESIQSKVIYPKGAKWKASRNDVIISGLIDTTGKVIRTRIEYTGGAAFDSAAAKALRDTRFTPATSNGIPVKLWYTVPVRFTQPTK